MPSFLSYCTDEFYSYRFHASVHSPVDVAVLTLKVTVWDLPAASQNGLATGWGTGIPLTHTSKLCRVGRGAAEFGHGDPGSPTDAFVGFHSTRSLTRTTAAAPTPCRLASITQQKLIFAYRSFWLVALSAHHSRGLLAVEQGLCGSGGSQYFSKVHFGWLASPVVAA